MTIIHTKTIKHRGNYFRVYFYDFDQVEVYYENAYGLIQTEGDDLPPLKDFLYVQQNFFNKFFDGDYE